MSRNSSSSSRGYYIRVRSRDDSKGDSSFACATWGPLDVTMCNAIIKERIEVRSSIKIKSIMKV